MRDTLDRFPPTIVMTDANARMGSETCDVCGPIGPKDQLDFNGLELQKLARQYDMMITDTFFLMPTRSHFGQSAVHCTGWTTCFYNALFMIVQTVATL